MVNLNGSKYSRWKNDTFLPIEVIELYVFLFLFNDDLFNCEETFEFYEIVDVFFMDMFFIYINQFFY